MVEFDRDKHLTRYKKLSLRSHPSEKVCREMDEIMSKIIDYDLGLSMRHEKWTDES